MDELESAVFLSRPTSAALLAIEEDDHVLLCGGQSGLVRLYHVSYSVNSGTTSKSGRGSKAKAEARTHYGDVGTFACCALFTIATSGPQVAVSLLATTAPGARGSNTPSRYQKPPGAQLSTSIASLLLQEDATALGADQVTVVTTDQSFITYDLRASSPEPHKDAVAKRKGRSKKGLVTGVGAGNGLLFTLQRQWLAGYDDVLDVSLAPLPKMGDGDGEMPCEFDWRKLAMGSGSPPSNEEEKEEEVRQSNCTALDVSSAFMTVAATNSPHLRVKLGSTGRAGASRILYGHTDVVLSIAQSPDG